ncbi:PREDICTED: putative DNA-binding protein At1g48610 [Tarenaya hassleriana]|uniref:putative DNA-binding protein At1g48610 n=1 Tax=Tarenaya hassleriana TaxID=28532 RepID=UPI00053C45C8|nr:PREDICTED: putative DNA-binding protein At1g48610 [Tarenaya hassleriana]
MATRSLNSLSAVHKRGRGRPPKRKPDFHQNDVTDEAPPAKRPRGRPRKDGAPVGSKAAPMAESKQKGRGRPRKSKPVSTLERVSPIIVNDPRKRGGRPKKSDAASVEIVEETVVAPAKRRGRPPKIDSVISVSHSGRQRGRPRKDATAVEVPREEEAADYGALERKYEFLQDKVKEAAGKLKAAFSAMEEIQVIAAEMNTERSHCHRHG